MSNKTYLINLSDVWYFTWNKTYLVTNACIGRSKGGVRDACPPEGPNSFNFHAVFGKCWQNSMLSCLAGLLHPPRKSRIRHWFATLNKTYVVCNVDVWNYILNKPTWLIIQMFGTLRLNFLSFKKITTTVKLVTTPTDAITLCTIPMVFVPVEVSSAVLFIILVALVNVSFECIISIKII